VALRFVVRSGSPLPTPPLYRHSSLQGELAHLPG
jgi:hypothetical protein